MGGYLETLTDPAYHGQIIMQTFPLIGNYGVISEDLEHSKVFAKAYIVKHLCREPSNFRSEGSLDIFLRNLGVVGLSGIDTRALTKLIRDNGVLKGKICTSPPTDADKAEAAKYRITDAVAAVSMKDEHTWKVKSPVRKVALVDFGAKRSLANSLAKRGCDVTVFPYDATADVILGGDYDAIVLSGGPGNPAAPEYAPIVEEIKKLVASGVPILGLELGHQLLAIANGYKTEPLPFGHRGTNQPVKDLSTGRVYMSSQNHGYTVVADKSDKNIAFVNVNDSTCEGLDYGKSMSVQFCPCGNSADTAFITDRFVERLGG
jgi:carbamoyl-phosphate synthase small subunit